MVADGDAFTGFRGRFSCGVSRRGKCDGRGCLFLRRETREWSDGHALGMEAEMIVPFRLDDHFVQRDACRCQSEIPPPPIVGGGMVQLLQRTARRRGGGDQRFPTLVRECVFATLGSVGS